MTDFTCDLNMKMLTHSSPEPQYLMPVLGTCTRETIIPIKAFLLHVILPASSNGKLNADFDWKKHYTNLLLTVSHS